MNERELFEAVAELRGQVRELQGAVAALRLDLDHVEHHQVQDLARAIEAIER